MRTGISISVTASDRARLQAIVAARSSPQKHVWRARIILLTDQGLGANAIMAATAKSKTCVWRWQDPDNIIAAVRRGHQTLESIH